MAVRKKRSTPKFQVNLVPNETVRAALPILKLLAKNPEVQRLLLVRGLRFSEAALQELEASFPPSLEALLQKNQEESRQAMRRQQAQIKAACAQAQNDCSHLQGLGEGPQSSQTCIIWHTFADDDPQTPKGICLHCQRVFRPSDPDYELWRKKPSACRASSGCLNPRSSTYPYTAGMPIPDLASVSPDRDMMTRDAFGFPDPFGDPYQETIKPPDRAPATCGPPVTRWSRVLAVLRRIVIGFAKS